MRVAHLRAEVGMNSSVPAALRSPLPSKLRKHHEKKPVRPSPLSLSALRPKSEFATSTQNPAHTNLKKALRPNKLTLPSLSGSDPQLSPDHKKVTKHAGSTLREHFEIISKVEVAIYGVVVKARRRTDDKIVAIKILDKERVRKRLSMKDTPVFENAQVELTVLQKSAENPHPNVLRSIPVGGSEGDVLHDSRSIYCITPFCDKGELYNTISASKGLAAATAVRAFSGIVSAVQHLHNRLGYVHNDISPENVLLRTMQRVDRQAMSGTVEDMETIPVLTDFGLATPIGQPASRVPGKTTYQAPEVLYSRNDSRIAEASSDVFSLGVLFFVMLTGLLPYARPHKSDPKYAALQEGAAAFGGAMSQWDVDACTTLLRDHPDLLRLVCDMTRHNPRDRPSLAEVFRRLQVWEESSTASTAAASSSSTHRHATSTLVLSASTTATNTLQLPSEPLRGRLRRRQRRSTGQDLACETSESKHSGARLSSTVGSDFKLDDIPFTLESGSCSADDAEDTASAGPDDWLLSRRGGTRTRKKRLSTTRRCAFQSTPSPTPTLDGNSPSGVAELAFMRQRRLDGRELSHDTGSAAARALLLSSGSNCSSGSNNEKQHAAEHHRRRLSPATRKTPPKRLHLRNGKSPHLGLREQILSRKSPLDLFRVGVD
eukprot:INCI1018.1.p1 GENE.INCI1018.1~~INCI1018.1.p1  ORF type:complete len:658 (-),score=97.22 INCI1018.1:90-2063(-)